MAKPPTKIRFYIDYSGWQPGQLRSEAISSTGDCLRGGDEIVCAATRLLRRFAPRNDRSDGRKRPTGGN